MRRVSDQRRDGSPTRLYREKAVCNHLQTHCHRMETPINVYILEKYTCLEPQVGEELLPLYPDFLSDEQKASFELHAEGCEFCQERWKLWRTTGLALRVEGLLSRAQALLRQGQYGEAITWYKKALPIAPDVFETPEGSLRTWTIRPGTKQRLGTLATVFGSTELADIARILRTFRVFSL